MIHMVIEVDDHPAWVECTKAAVAERLSDLGGVRVVDVNVDKPQQMGMEGYRAKPPAAPPPMMGSRGTCPKCGARYTREPGPEGAVVDLDIKPRAIWPDPHGPDWAKNAKGEWVRVRLDGDLATEHTVGFAVHRCRKEDG